MKRVFVCTPEDLAGFNRRLDHWFLKSQFVFLMEDYAEPYQIRNSIHMQIQRYIEEARRYGVEPDETTLHFAEQWRISLDPTDLHYFLHHIIYQMYMRGLEVPNLIPSDRMKSFYKAVADCLQGDVPKAA